MKRIEDKMYMLQRRLGKNQSKTKTHTGFILEWLHTWKSREENVSRREHPPVPDA